MLAIFTRDCLFNKTGFRRVLKLRASLVWMQVAFLTSLIAAVTSAQVTLQFDAATVKLDQRGPGDRRMHGGPGTSSPTHVTWHKAWLADLVATAFHARRENISGPNWIVGNGAQLYSFEATLPSDTYKHDFEVMFQNFLIGQFALKMHNELKPFHAYALVEGLGGARLKAAANPDAPDLPPVMSSNAGPDGFPILPPGHGHGISLLSGAYYVRFQNYNMSELAEYLINFVAPGSDETRYVIDKTGLKGLYDFTLKFDPAGMTPTAGPGTPAALSEARAADPTGLPNIFKALEQQLGLKLAKTTDIQLETVIIDQAERIPRGN